MQKIILFLAFSTTLLLAKAPEPKVFRSYDNEHQEHYSNSSHMHDDEDQIISSTAEASSEISVGISLQATSEATSGEHQGSARMSYLDDNRVQITQDIAQGKGEYLTTLLTMLEIPSNEKNLEKIQKSFDELIYLSHNDFLNKLQTLINKLHA